jgi:putative NADH-flavin reductase
MKKRLSPTTASSPANHQRNGRKAEGHQPFGHGRKGVVIHSLGRSYLSAESNAIAVVDSLSYTSESN